MSRSLSALALAGATALLLGGCQSAPPGAGSTSSAAPGVGSTSSAAPGTSAGVHTPAPIGSVAARDYRVDPFWPQPLPQQWLLGAVAGVAVDHKDHVWIIQRPSTLTDDEKAAAFQPPKAECCVPAPSVIVFDATTGAYSSDVEASLRRPSHATVSIPRDGVDPPADRRMPHEPATPPQDQPDRRMLAEAGQPAIDLARRCIEDAPARLGRPAAGRVHVRRRQRRQPRCIELPSKLRLGDRVVSGRGAPAGGVPGRQHRCRPGRVPAQPALVTPVARTDDQVDPLRAIVHPVARRPIGHPRRSRRPPDHRSHAFGAPRLPTDFPTGLGRLARTQSCSAWAASDNERSRGRTR